MSLKKKQTPVPSIYLRGGRERESGGGRLLLGWVVGKADTLRDIALQAFYSCFEEGIF